MLDGNIETQQQPPFSNRKEVGLVLIIFCERFTILCQRDTKQLSTASSAAVTQSPKIKAEQRLRVVLIIYGSSENAGLLFDRIFKDCSNLLPTFYNESDAFLIHHLNARMQRAKMHQIIIPHDITTPLKNLLQIHFLKNVKCF